MTMENLFTRTITSVLTGALFLGTYLFSGWLFILLLIAIMGVIVLYEWPRVIGMSLSEPVFWYRAILYPIFPFFVLFYMVIMYRLVSFIIPLYPFIASWLVDTGAYLVGARWGRHLVVPSITPKKTWEGVGGGIVCLFAFNVALKYWKHLPESFFSLLLATFIIAFMAMVGDIFISLLKRRQGIKDTGTLLPGHGGLLDRFDSVLFLSLTFFCVEVVRKLSLFL